MATRRAPGGAGAGAGPLRAVAVVATTLALLLAGTLGFAPPAAAQVAQAFVDDNDLAWGDTTTLRGSGWAPGTELQAILYGPGSRNELARPVVAGDGTITASLTIPDGLGSSRDYVLAVQGTALDRTIGYVEVPLTIQGPEATLAVANSELRWGDTTTVSGTRWEPGTAVDITLMPVTQVLARATVGGDGTFSIAVPIPADIPSSRDYRIVATGQGINKLFSYVPSPPITIIGPSPAMSVSDTVLAWGQQTTVIGERFKPGTVAQVHLLPTSLPLGEVTVPAGGRFELVVTIPDDLPASAAYQIAATGTGIDSLFAFVGQAVTIIGPSPFITVTDVSGPDGRALQVDGERFMRGTSATLTLLPEFAELGKAPVGPDGRFSIQVAIPTEGLLADPHQLVVTGQAADGQFAYVGRSLTLGDGGPVGIGSALLPPGGLRERGEPGPTRIRPGPGLDDELALKPVKPKDESADELGLALLLLLFFAAVAFFLRYSLRHDVGVGLRRLLRLPWRRPKTES